MDTKELSGRFYNADGSLSAYALGCGYVEVAENDEYRRELYREHSCYHVRMLDYKARDAGAPFSVWRQWYSMPTLSEARRKFRQMAKVAMGDGYEPISRHQIRMLRDEAAAAGDLKQVALCDTAISSEVRAEREAARAECERVIRYASEQ